MAREELLKKLQESVGKEIGVTEWFTVSQRDADAFAALTDDWDYMHNDPEWAGERFGGTIAHGFYVLSLIPSFLKQVAPFLPIVATDDSSVLNYGLNKVRIVSPLRIGQPARDRIEVVSAVERKPGDYLTAYRHTIEKQGEEKPFLVAESLSYYVTGYAEKWNAKEEG